MNGCEIMKCTDYRDGVCHYESDVCKYRDEVSVDSNSLLSVEHILEQFTPSGKSVWKRGILPECQKELRELREELPNFNPAEWRIVRVETHLVTDNAHFEPQKQEESNG